MTKIQPLVTINGHGKTVTTSLAIANELNRRHHDVLRLIDQLYWNKTVQQQNFFQSTYKNSQGKTYRMYEVTWTGIGILSSELRAEGKRVIEKFHAAFEYSKNHTHNGIDRKHNNENLWHAIKNAGIKRLGRNKLRSSVKAADCTGILQTIAKFFSWMRQPSI
jgi:phage regulator Rha-like protein